MQAEHSNGNLSAQKLHENGNSPAINGNPTSCQVNCKNDVDVNTGTKMKNEFSLSQRLLLSVFSLFMFGCQSLCIRDLPRFCLFIASLFYFERSRDDEEHTLKLLQRIATN
jgi:hypothetical protein